MKFEFADNNLLVPSNGASIQQFDPRPEDILHIRCPHCLILGSFPAATRTISFSKAALQTSKSRSIAVFASIRVCPNPSCKGIVFALSNGSEKFLTLPKETLDFNTENIPDPLVRSLKEAIICHANGAYRASSMMVRRVLEELCDDCGATGKTLHDRLRALRSQIILPDELFDAMDELKAMGNDAAHIEAKAYKSIDDEEAQISIEIAQEILKARYQHKSLLDKIRARRGTT